MTGVVLRSAKIPKQNFVPAAQQLISLSDNNKIRAAHWVDHQ